MNNQANRREPKKTEKTIYERADRGRREPPGTTAFIVNGHYKLML